MITLNIDRQKNLSGRHNTRYAPSPTGSHHIGGARTALVSQLIAVHSGGNFMVRFEDTDRNRLVLGASDEIHSTLRWLLGDAYYSTNWQSARHRANRYSDWASSAIANGNVPLYYCSMTPEMHQLAKEWVASPHTVDIAPVVEHFMILAERNTPFVQFMGEEYETASTEAEIMTALRAGVRNHRYSMPWIPNGFRPLAYDPFNAVIRFGVEHRRTDWYEPAGGGRYFSVNAAQLTDPVLIKSDGWPTYHLAAMYDDAMSDLTSIIVRGEEWLPSAPIHIQLLEHIKNNSQARLAATPQLVHLGVILAPDGKGKLSKRKAAEYDMPVLLTELREKGYHRIAVARWLLETVLPQEIADTYNGYKLEAEWDLSDLSVTPSQLSLSRLHWLQKQLFLEDPRAIYESILTNAVRADILASEMVVKNEQILFDFLRSRCTTKADVRKMTRYLHEYSPRRHVVAKVDKHLWAELKACRSRVAMINLVNSFAATASKQQRKETLMGLRELISGQEISPDIFTMIKTMRWSELKRRIKN